MYMWSSPVDTHAAIIAYWWLLLVVVTAALLQNKKAAETKKGSTEYSGIGDFIGKLLSAIVSDCQIFSSCVFFKSVDSVCLVWYADMGAASKCKS